MNRLGPFSSGDDVKLGEKQLFGAVKGFFFVPLEKRLADSILKCNR